MSNKNNSIAEFKNIQNRIFTFRGLQVMIDRDLAELYQVPVKRLNEQVKRNIDRFPIAFRFQLDKNEKMQLVANCDRFEKLKHSSHNPYAFTEHGVAMLSAVLRSDVAVKVSIQIIQTFVKMRKFLLNNAVIFQRLDKLEIKQIETDNKINRLFNALQSKELNPKQGIFFEGQIFDAYVLITYIIKSARRSIILVDNYLDETVLTMLAKRQKNCKAVVYTRHITKQLKHDIEKHNAQYPVIDLKKLTTSHDRFLIIDRKIVYHIGASLKDAGKKWFAFSKLEIAAEDIINKL